MYRVKTYYFFRTLVGEVEITSTAYIAKLTLDINKHAYSFIEMLLEKYK